MTTRALKKELAAALAGAGWRERLEELATGEPKALVGPLLSLLLARAEIVRWRAAEGFGVVMPAIAERSLEDARVVMRRFLWHMNEESGNIGWGVAEAMGASMAGEPRLAAEYRSILFSYVHEMHGRVCHGNFLDHPQLRHGVFWAIGRLAEARPELAAEALPDLLAALDPAKAVEGREGTPEGLTCHDAPSRGLACRAVGLLWGVLDAAQAAQARAALRGVAGDAGRVRLYRGDRLEDTTVAALAAEALGKAP